MPQIHTLWLKIICAAICTNLGVTLSTTKQSVCKTQPWLVLFGPDMVGTVSQAFERNPVINVFNETELGMCPNALVPVASGCRWTLRSMGSPWTST